VGSVRIVRGEDTVDTVEEVADARCCCRSFGDVATTSSEDITNVGSGKASSTY
jgi:hypothetical protein